MMAMNEVAPTPRAAYSERRCVRSLKRGSIASLEGQSSCSDRFSGSTMNGGGRWEQKEGRTTTAPVEETRRQEDEDQESGRQSDGGRRAGSLLVSPDDRRVRERETRGQELLEARDEGKRGDGKTRGAATLAESSHLYLSSCGA